MTEPPILKVAVYTPESSMANPFRMARAMFADLWAGRELAWRLAVRDISAQYRRSFLGILWALILPLANTLVWLFLNGSGIVQLQETPIPYPVYVFLETLLWAIFMASIAVPMQQCAATLGMWVNYDQTILQNGVVREGCQGLSGLIPTGMVRIEWQKAGMRSGMSETLI